LTPWEIRIPLKRVPTVGLEIIIGYTVTDAGIEAGETLDDALDEAYVCVNGDDTCRIWECQVGELPTLMQILRGGVTTGRYTDTLPTTATLHRSFWLMPMMHDLSRYRQVELVLVYNAMTTAWAGASAFTGEARAKQYTSPEARGTAVSVKRYVDATSKVDHTFRVPAWMDLTAIYAVISTGNISKLEVTDDSNSRDLNIENDFQGKAMAQRWATWTEGTYTSGTDVTVYVDSFLSLSSERTRRVNHRVYLEMSAAGTVTRIFLVGHGAPR
jgi:hypothetical protein